MKILYHHRIASKDGQYVHIEEMVNAFKKLGHEVIIIGPSVVVNNEFGSEGGVISILKKVIPGAIYEILELAYSIIVYIKLKKAIKRHNPDYIYERYNLYMPAGIVAKRKFNLPILLEVNAPLYDERKKHNGISLARLAKWSEQFVWRNADHILCVTHVLADIIEYNGVQKERITITPNGINPEKFIHVIEHDKAKELLGLNDSIVLGFVGFMRKWHGLEMIINFIAREGNKKIHILLVGDGPGRAEIEEKAKRAGVESQVTITGVVSRDRVTDYISAFDIALQPAVVSYASPLKLFEYLALGKAILAPAAENIMEILESNKNAILFEPENMESLNKGLRLLINNAELRKGLGRAAQLTIKKNGYTWENNAITSCKIANKYIQIREEGQVSR